ncbi:MAG: hypothetical protein ACRD26_24685, partial [Vicinamibacterales bacterium]
MPKSGPVAAPAAVGGRLAAFVVERYPFAIGAVQRALESAGTARAGDRDVAAIDGLRARLGRELARCLEADVADLPETTPGVSASARLASARAELADAVDG